MTPTLYIIRGLPGSGKSTYARKTYPYLPLYEADDFFTNQSTYNWSYSFIKQAHKLCLLNATKELYHHNSVVVANTFTTIKEMQPYLDLEKTFPYIKIHVIEMLGKYKSIHNVPEKTLQHMADRWEQY